VPDLDYDLSSTYVYPLIVVPTEDQPLPDNLLKQNEVLLVFFAGLGQSTSDLLDPIVNNAFGRDSDLSLRYIPAAQFLTDKDAPIGLDTTGQLSATTWQELLMRLTPTDGMLEFELSYIVLIV
jgi:hypothetical protein